MSIVDTIKHAPRWTWYTIAGVTGGSIALKLWHGRNAPPVDQTAGDGTTTGDVGSVQPATTGSSPAGVIVPPVIMGSDGGNAADVLGAVSGLFTPFFDDFTAMMSQAWTGDQALLNQMIVTNQDIAETVITAQANGGTAPQPADQNPPPVIINMPAPSAPPAPAPPAPSKPKTCPDIFPFHPHHNPNNGPPSGKSCYYNECNSDKKEVHVYGDGHKVLDGDPCSPKGKKW